MPMPIHIRNPDGMPYQIQSVVTPSRKLSPEDLYKAGAITAKEYLSRTGRLQPADGLASALMPRTAAADDAGTLQQLLAGVSDVASLPGRAYASLGRPAGEPYQSALARLAATQGEGGADRFSEGVLRDPANILAPIGLSALSKIPAVARGLVAAGRYGSLAADVGANTAAQAVANKAIGEDAGVPQSAALNLAFGLGAHGLSGLARSGMRMISPEERAANFKNWFGDSKVVDEAGNPLMVYHGGAHPVDAFTKRPERGGGFGAGYFSSDPNVATAYATTGQPPGSELARKFRDGAVTNTYLSIRNPINENTTFEQFFNGDKDRALSLVEDITDRNEFEEMRDIAVNGSDKDFWSGIESLELSGLNVNHELYTPLLESSPLLRSLGNYSGGEYYQGLIKPTAFDGIIHNDFENGGKTFIPFKPTQIKSATGNRGTFDPTDPNITHFAGGPAYPQSLASIAASRIVNSGKQAAAMKAQEQ